MWNSIVQHFGFTEFVAIRLAVSLLLTLAVELPVAAALGFRSRRELAAVAWVNLLTNPPLVLALLMLDVLLVMSRAAIFWPAVIALEALVVVVESLLLQWATKRPFRTTFKVSLLMNGASLVAGLFLWVALGGLIISAINSAWTPSG